MDFTRIAQGDGGLWRDILIDSRDNLRVGVERLQRELTDLLRLIDAGDEAAAQRWLDPAARRRQGLNPVAV